MTLENGYLKNGETVLAYGNGFSYEYDANYWHYTLYTLPDAIKYVYSKMGFSLLEGDTLNYANEETRLGLSPSGERQYGYRILGEASGE